MMVALSTVVLRREGRGFIVTMPQGEHHYPPATARQQPWYAMLSANDRLTVDVWLGAWARKAVQ